MRFIMAKDNKAKENPLEKLAMYEYGAVAGRFIKQSPELAKKALEALVKSDYLPLDDATKEYLIKSTSDPKGPGVKLAAETYANAYSNEKSALTIGNLIQYYEDTLRGYLDQKEVEPIRVEFKGFAKETYGDIMKKVGRASYVLEGEGKYNFSDKEKEEARSVVETYSNLLQFLKTMDEVKIKPLMDKIQNDSIKDNLKEFSEGLKQEQEAKLKKAA